MCLNFSWIDKCCRSGDREEATKDLEDLLSYLGRIRYFLRPAVEEKLREESERTGWFEVNSATIRRRQDI